MAVGTETVTRASAAPFWYDQRFRAIFFQVLVLGLLCLFAAFIIYNTAQNLRQRGISSGFDFLWHTAGFDIGFSLTQAPNASVRIAGDLVLRASELPAVDRIATVVRPGTST